jgi:sugar O-acyltransferase (sialic acid O-acetyltransferase NeuD family)
VSSVRDQLILIGAGDLAREVAWAASRALHDPLGAPEWTLAGFTVTGGIDAPDQLAGGGVTLPNLGDLESLADDPRNVFLCAVADPRAKLAITAPLRARRARFANVVDPTAAVAPDATLGTGVYLARLATIAIGARVGDDCAVNMYASVGHDVVIGDGCTVSSHCDITGRVVVGRGVMLGSHAVVLPRGKVGDFAVVGAGSVVLRSVRPETSAFGVPARTI